jgi:arabinoxylan arabinofuranohydrolase
MKQAFNPYLPAYEYVPDGEPYVFGDRVYVYGSHDEAHGTFYCTGDYVGWSAPVDDLGDWHYEGVIYKKNQDPANLDSTHVMFAPDVVVGPDGRYYLYYGLDFVPEICVAVCDTPAGQYEFYGKVHWPADRNGGAIMREDMPFDPSVLVDDDGRIFLYSGFGPWFDLKIVEGFKPSPGGMVIELEPDMVTIKSDPKIALPTLVNSAGTGFENHAFFEASSMRKINGTYYYLYSSNQGHELCYATSQYPDREFTCRGTIVSNGDVGLNERTTPVYYMGNNHGGLVQIKGQWYIFYHRQTHGTEFSRQGCAEPVTILADGSIPQVEITSFGLAPNRSMPAKGYCPAHVVCHLAGPAGAWHIHATEHAQVDDPVIIEETAPELADGLCQVVTNLQDGAVAGYKYFEFAPVAYVKSISLEARGQDAWGEVRVTLDAPGEAGHLVATIPVDLDAPEFHLIQGSLEEIEDRHALYLEYRGTGHIDLKSIRFGG